VGEPLATIQAVGPQLEPGGNRSKQSNRHFLVSAGFGLPAAGPAGFPCSATGHLAQPRTSSALASMPTFGLTRRSRPPWASSSRHCSSMGRRLDKKGCDRTVAKLRLRGAAKAGGNSTTSRLASRVVGPKTRRFERAAAGSRARKRQLAAVAPLAVASRGSRELFGASCRPRWCCRHGDWGRIRSQLDTAGLGGIHFKPAAPRWLPAMGLS